jgi:hypothetical protein
MMARDLSSWLPGLLGPVELREDGTIVIAPRKAWNFIGISVTDDEANDRVNFEVEPASTTGYGWDPFVPEPVGAPPSPPSHTAALGNQIVGVDLSDADVTSAEVVLQAADVDGACKIIKDAVGNFSTKNLTITPDSGQIQQFDGTMGASLVLDQDGDSVHLCKMFGNWVIL